MTKEQKEIIIDSQVQIIHELINKKASHEDKAKCFIQTLPVFTEKCISSKNIADFNKESASLNELFDSFTIVDEFTDFLIIDCYNEIKISLMKWKRFADKTSSTAHDFKKLLDHFYEVMKDLYFYEIFGFFSTTVHPEDIPELNLPCKIFCGCAEGWEKEPYLTADGKVAYEKVIRFQDPKNKQILFCITIENPHLLEPREKCSLSDEQLEVIKNFVRVNKGIIVLHNMALVDSPSFHAALKIKITPKDHPVQYRIVYSYKESDKNIPLPSKKYYIDMDDMSYEEAINFFDKIKHEMQNSFNAGPVDYALTSLEILRPNEGKNFCCFCDSVFDGDGNSTWPIYYKMDGEKYRCCDACNKKYVIAARKDRTLIMQFREQFGIDYTEYQEYVMVDKLKFIKTIPIYFIIFIFLVFWELKLELLIVIEFIVPVILFIYCILKRSSLLPKVIIAITLFSMAVNIGLSKAFLNSSDTDKNLYIVNYLSNIPTLNNWIFSSISIILALLIDFWVLKKSYLYVYKNTKMSGIEILSQLDGSMAFLFKSSVFIIHVVIANFVFGVLFFIIRKDFSIIDTVKFVLPYVNINTILFVVPQIITATAGDIYTYFLKSKE